MSNSSTRTVLVALIVFTTSLVLYRANAGNVYTYDSAPASLFALNALDRQTLAFDDFRNAYLDGPATKYIFTEAPDGHLEPIFPIGTALLASPVYLVDYALLRSSGPLPDITSAAFEPKRLDYEKQASTLLAALAAALFFACAMRMTRLPVALVATGAFAFGSDMWTVGSQALWQHGPVALVTLGMVYGLLLDRPRKRGWALFAAGLCAGFLPVVRPTAIVYSVAGIVFVALFASGKRLAFAAGVALGVLPGLLWNLSVFHSSIGGYAVNDRSYEFSISQFFDGASGLLVSPSRGLLVYSPFVIFSIAGAVVVWKESTHQARLMQFLSLASVVTFLNYAFFTRWQGGSTFGPRYLTDVIPTAALLLIYVFPRKRDAPSAFAIANAVALSAVIIVSVGIQVAGANGEPKTNWSGVPLDISVAPSRIWSWRDTQIERDARATLALVLPNPTFPERYVDGFAGRIDRIEPLGGSPNQRIPVAAVLVNTGTSPWFNYETGLFFGQLHVRVRLLDSSGALASEQYVYTTTSPTAGETTTTIGDIDLPSVPGRYTAFVDIDVFQDARIGPRHLGLRSLEVVVKER